ncbi:MAG: HD domain-containing protein [Parcubacteria group bacterium]|nr:HD domain-containing protein [Parcubacteria group bacterium]
MEDKIEKIKEIVKEELSQCSAHGFDHVERVYNLAMKIAETEDIDLEVVKIAALLHDVGGKRETDDNTGKTDHASESAKMARPILESLNYPEDKIQHIQDCILSHRYRNEHKPKTKEAQLIFDADKIDALGAIGLARTFAWIGRNNAFIYKKVNTEEYINENLGGKIDGRIKDKTKHSAQINYETKVKHIVNLLHTKKGKEIGTERTKFFKDFLNRMEKEIRGEL